MTVTKRKPITIRSGNHVAKIYTTASRGVAIYQLAYYRGGKRERRSFADLGDARHAAGVALAELNGCELETERFTHPELQSLAIAKATIAPSGLPLHVVCEQFMGAHTKLAGQCTVLQAVEHWLSDFNGVKKKPIPELVELFVQDRIMAGVTDTYVNSCRRFLGMMHTQFENRPIHSIKAQELDTWLDSFVENGNTRLAYRKGLVAFGNWCRKHEYLPEKQTEFEKMRQVRLVDKEVTIYSPEDMRKILDAAKPEVLPYVAIGAFAGLRFAEIQRLEWKDIRLDRKHILVAAEKSKTRQRRIVPILPVLEAWLRPYEGLSGRVVCYKGENFILQRLCRKTGTTYQRNGLRHSFVSYRLADTGDAARTALEAGHDQKILFKHYREAVTPEQGAAWFKLFPKRNTSV